jgi:hypothetical protein
MNTTTMPAIRIDRNKTLGEEPGTGHNRWHPDIPPKIWCDPGDEVILETRDAFDGQMGRDVSLADVAGVNLDVLHPLTGPVYINGAEPGDLLDIEIVDIEPDSYGYTSQVPGFGFLRDEFPDPFKVSWDIADGWATSADLPGVRIPGATSWARSGSRPVTSCWPRRRRGNKHCSTVAVSCCPRLPHPPFREIRTSPSTLCGRSLRASRAETWTSNNSARARTFSFRSMYQAGSSPPATPTTRISEWLSMMSTRISRTSRESSTTSTRIVT